MTVAEARRPAPPQEHRAGQELGPLGRLGGWTAGHVRVVALAWVAVAVGLGVFAPKVEHALSGAGWEASGSESVEARELIQASFAGLSSQALIVVVHSEGQTLSDPGFRQVVARVERILRASPDVALLVDEYDEDWSRLWWVRLRGRARVVEEEPEREDALALLAAKYPQYRDEPPPGPAIVVELTEWRGWAAVP